MKWKIENNFEEGIKKTVNYYKHLQGKKINTSMRNL